MKKDYVKHYHTRKFLDYTLVLFLLLLLLFIWQLYRGPISAPFLKPYILAALNHDTENSEVTVESVNIELVRSIKPIKIIANNVVYKENNDSMHLNAPKVSVSFSIKALLQGMIAPSSIEISNPSVYVFTSYGVAKEDKASDITYKQLDYYISKFENFLERFNSPDKTYAESYINDITITDGEFEFHEIDLGRKWVLKDVGYHFERNFTNIISEINGFLDLKDKVVTIGAEAEYRPSKNKLALQVYFSDLVPADIVNTYVNGNIKKDIYEINLPINGRIATMVNFDEFRRNRRRLVKAIDTAIEKINFQLEGGAGNIVFSADDIMSKYDISSFELEGEVVGGLNKISVKNADFNLGGQKLTLGVDISGWGRYLLQGKHEDLEISLTADIDKLKLDDLYVYWPRYIASEAWEWCKDSIFGGDAENAHFQFDFAYDNKSGTIGFKDLSGGALIVDSNLRYINTMPIVNNVYGEFKVYKNSLEILVDKATSVGVILDKGKVRIYDLDKYNNYIDIKLTSKSSIKDALKLIDHEPLSFASEMGLNSTDIQGEANTELDLHFELKKDLGYEDVKVSVKSDLKDVSINGLIEGKPIKAKDIKLFVNNDGMNLSGDASVENIPMSIEWNEDFRKKRKFKSKYKIVLKADSNIAKKLGIDSAVVHPPYFEGYANVNAEAIVDLKDNTTVSIKADLADAYMNFGFFGFHKPLKEDASLLANLDIKGGKVAAIPSFSLTKKDFALEGKIDLDKKGSVSVIDIQNVKGPRTKARARIELAENSKQSIKVNISGNSYDLSDFFEGKENSAKQEAAKNNRIPTADLSDIPNIDINIAVNRLWTNPDVSVTNFAGNAKLVKGVGLSELHLIGNYDDNRTMNLKVDYVPRPNNEYLLSISSNHAGNTLRFLRIYNYMRGGNLQINAKRTSDKEFIGHAKIRDFSLHNTPPLTKLLTVASFTGMVNMLRGDGMAFSHFDAPFRLKDGIITVNDAKTYGNVMGITFKGAYNIYNDDISIEGTFAPAYGLNTLIGKIPLVGRLLAGKDGTVFAANYSLTGQASNPNVSLNPLSAMSPNSLKEVVSSVFGED